MSDAEILEEAEGCAISIVEALLAHGVRFIGPPEEVPDLLIPIIAASLSALTPRS